MWAPPGPGIDLGVPCIAGKILNPWATRKVPAMSFQYPNAPGGTWEKFLSVGTLWTQTIPPLIIAMSIIGHVNVANLTYHLVYRLNPTPIICF